MAEDVPLSSPPPLIPFLPDDVSMLCIARVPVAYHRALSHVSRSWRSFVRSPSFFSVRSILSVTEPVLTVSIRSLDNNDRSRWYHLHPHQPPSLLPPTLLGRQEEHVDNIETVSASLGPRLFLLGGNSLQIYDARLCRWSHGPPLSTPLRYATATVAGGRVHVLSCPDNLLHPPLIESLDIAGTRWDPLPPIPIPAHMFRKRPWRCAVMDGKLIVFSGGRRQIGPPHYAAAFDPDTAKWAPASSWGLDSALAVVGGVPYVFVNDMKRIFGYGDDGRWRPVEGEFFAELLCPMYNVRLLNFRGLLCLVWEEMGRRSDDLGTISCTVIDISRTDNGGFRGSVLWSDLSLLALSMKESLHHCVVLEL